LRGELYSGSLGRQKERTVEATISKKGKIIILVCLVLAAAPIYLLSMTGVQHFVDQAWEHADDSRSPEKILWWANLLNNTYREPEAEALFVEWLKHYGGDETETDQNLRIISWQPYPWNNDDHPRPPQHGEDYRKDPHPLTAKVLVLYGERLERMHQYQQAVHIFSIITNDTLPFSKDTEVRARAQKGIDRNGSGRNQF
jgi:hypothetical protein